MFGVDGVAGVDRAGDDPARADVGVRRARVGNRGRAPDDYWARFGAGPSNLPEEHHSTTWIGDRAAETLEGWQPGRPALLMVGFIKPHHPFDPPAPLEAR